MTRLAQHTRRPGPRGTASSARGESTPDVFRSAAKEDEAFASPESPEEEFDTSSADAFIGATASSAANLAANRQGLHAKLEIGSSDDPLEREADRVAEAVTSNAWSADSNAYGEKPRVMDSLRTAKSEGAIYRKEEGTTEGSSPEAEQIIVYEPADDPEICMVHLHGNEEQAKEIAIELKRLYRANFVYIHQEPPARLVKLSFVKEGSRSNFKVDPNRIFTDQGIQNEVEDDRNSAINAQADSKQLAIEATKGFSLVLRSKITEGRGGSGQDLMGPLPLVALHNNTDVANAVNKKKNLTIDYYIENQGKPGYNIEKASKVETEDPDDFIFVTNEIDYQKYEGIRNVVLQVESPSEERKEEAGSLAVAVALEGKKLYERVEALLEEILGPYSPVLAELLARIIKIIETRYINIESQIGQGHYEEGLELALDVMEGLGIEPRPTNEVEVNVALFDQNPDHMQKGKEQTQLNSFRAWGTDWAGEHGGSANAVSTHNDIKTALLDVISGLQPGEKIGSIACFGHGSSSGGWAHMGNISNILMEPAIRERLSIDIQVILYMCLAGAQPATGLETIEAPGEVPAKEAGGAGSFAGQLRDRLLGVGLEGATVWAHTVAGVAVTSAHWRVFSAEEGEPGEAYFRLVFGETEAINDFAYLLMCLRTLGSEGQEERDRTREFPASVEDLADRWMWKFYLNIVTGQPVAIRIPVDPEGCRSEILGMWRKYRNGDNSVLVATDDTYSFLENNGFDDLRLP